MTSLSNHRPQLTIRCPEDAIAAAPYLIGFHPHDSVLVIGYSADGVFVVRYDLVDPDGYPAFTAHLYEAMIANRADGVILLGYGSHERALPMLAEARDALETILTVKEVLHVWDGRWRSTMCSELRCCPAEGRPYDIAASPNAAAAVIAGIAPFDSREAMENTLAPVQGQDLLWMQAQTERAEKELFSLWTPTSRLAEVGIPLVRRLTRSPRRLTDWEAARLSIAVTLHHRVSDEAVKRIVRRDAREQLAVWQDLTRRAVGRYAAGPAAVLAVAAYMSGDGAMAQMAVDRSLDAVPGYLLAEVVSSLLHHCTPPHVGRERLAVRRERLTVRQSESSPD